MWLGSSNSFNKLENEISRLIQLKPRSAEAHYLLSHLYIRKYSEKPDEMNILKKASDLAQQAIALSPRQEHGYVVLAEVLDVMGQTINGIQLLKQPNSVFSKGWRSKFILARLQSDSLDSSSILSLLEESLQKPDSVREIIAPYVVATLRSKHTGPNLISKLRSWDRKFPSETLKMSLAISLTRNDQPKLAHAIYVQIYTPSFLHLEAMLNDAILLMTQLKRPSQAKTLLHRVVKLAKTPDSKNSFKFAVASQKLGEAYLNEGSIKQAEKHFINAIVHSHNRYESINRVSEKYRERKKFQQLVSTIQTLNEEIPGSGVLYALLGETLSEDLSRHEEALDAFADAIILEPNRGDFYNGMGLAYYRANKLNRALNMFNFASRIDPEDAIAKYNSACILSIQKNYSQALLTLKEAIHLDPRLKKNAATDSDFKNLREYPGFADTIKGDSNTESFAH